MEKQAQASVIADQIANYTGTITQCPGTDNSSSQAWIEHIKESEGFNRARKRGQAAMRRKNAA